MPEPFRPFPAVRPFDHAPEGPARYRAAPNGESASREAWADLVALGPPAPVLDALAGPAGRGALGLVVDPLAFDPVVYLAFSSRLRECVYVGRTGDLFGRIARHRRAWAGLGAWWPDVWAAVRVAAPDAAAVEEGLARHLQGAGHPAHLLVGRRPYAGGHLVSGRQAAALERHGFVPT